MDGKPKRTAVHLRELGVRVRQAREQMPHVPTQAQAAELVGHRRNWWMDLEAGRLDPQLGDLERVAALVNRSMAELLGHEPSTMAPEGDSAKRRTFVTGAVGIVGGALTNHLLPDLPAPQPADHEYVEAMHEAIQRLVGLEVRFGGDELAGLAVRTFQSARRRLGVGAQSKGLMLDLRAVAGEMAELAGWLLHDADHQEASRQMNNEALFLARLAGDRSMELLILSNASLQALFARRPGEGLLIADAVLGDTALTPREQVIFKTRKARALAQLGDDGTALRLLAEAQSAYEDGASDREPKWTWWVDPAELRAHIAIAHGDLGRPAKAAELLQRSVEDCPPRRQSARFIYLAQQFRHSIQAGAWADAEALIDQACPYVAEVRSARTLGLLRDGVARIEASKAPPRLVEAGRHLSSLL